MKFILLFTGFYCLCANMNILSAKNKPIKVVLSDVDQKLFTKRLFPLKFNLILDGEILNIVVKNISEKNIAILKHPFGSSIQYFNKENKEQPGNISVIPALNIQALDHRVLLHKETHILAKIESSKILTYKLKYSGSFSFLDPVSGRYIKYELKFNRDFTEIIKNKLQNRKSK